MWLYNLSRQDCRIGVLQSVLVVDTVKESVAVLVKVSVVMDAVVVEVAVTVVETVKAISALFEADTPVCVVATRNASSQAYRSRQAVWR